jgi:hypothetical protein
VTDFIVNEKKEIEFHRPIFNKVTGNVLQSRVDIVNKSAIEARRAELVEELKDIDAFLADYGVKEALLKPVEEPIEEIIKEL